jgi:TRAP-type mannitol/chloroaromatic compound transport system permease small subunit
MLKIERAIDALNEKVGVATSLLAIPLVLVVVYEVIMRYFFDAPTSWGFELTTFLYGAHFMLGFAFCHKHDGHVAIDVFEAKLPARPRTILRIATNLVIFLPVVGMFTIWSIKYAITSWSLWERASSSWAPPIYPWKTVMAIGFALLLLQGIAKLIHDFRSLRGTDQ